MSVTQVDSAEGIYRVPGSKHAVDRLQKDFIASAASAQVRFHARRDLLMLQFTEMDCQEIHPIASLLKQYLRELPEPLLTEDSTPLFLASMGEAASELQIAAIKRACASIPRANLLTSQLLFQHLQRVASHESCNRMGPANLATCFGPTVLYMSMDPMASKDPMASPMLAR